MLSFGDGTVGIMVNAVQVDMTDAVDIERAAPNPGLVGIGDAVHVAPIVAVERYPEGTEERDRIEAVICERHEQRNVAHRTAGELAERERRAADWDRTWEEWE